MTEKILYGRFKHYFNIFHSPKYLRWLAKDQPELTTHHIVSRRVDYLAVRISWKKHVDGRGSAEQNKIKFFFENLHEALNNLFRYIKHLEE